MKFVITISVLLISATILIIIDELDFFDEHPFVTIILNILFFIMSIASFIYLCFLLKPAVFEFF